MGFVVFIQKVHFNKTSRKYVQQNTFEKSIIHKTVTIICILDFDENLENVSIFCIISLIFPEIIDHPPPPKSYNVSKRHLFLSYPLFAQLSNINAKRLDFSKQAYCWTRR